MELFNKEKMTKEFGKIVDVANDAADKVEQFAKDKELDEKADAAKEKIENFVKEKELDKKVTAIKQKAEDGIEGFQNRKYHKIK